MARFDDPDDRMMAASSMPAPGELEASPSPSAPLKVVTPEEEEQIDKIMALLSRAHTGCTEAGLFGPQLAKVTAAYEFVLDAVMYGYPGAVLRGWPEEGQPENPSWPMTPEEREAIPGYGDLASTIIWFPVRVGGLNICRNCTKEFHAHNPKSGLCPDLGN